MFNLYVINVHYQSVQAVSLGNTTNCLIKKLTMEAELVDQFIIQNMNDILFVFSQ